MSVDGNWRLVVQSPMGRQHLTVALHDDHGTLTGTLTNPERQLTADIFDGSVADSGELEWKVTLKQMKMTLVFTTTVAEDTMTGKVKAGLFGRFTVTGERER
jgi:hypothetical protein